LGPVPPFRRGSQAMNMKPSLVVDLRQIQRVLIIRLSSIGDVVHALPVSAALEEAFPHLEISWLVEEMSAPVVQGNPFLSDVIVIPRSRWKNGRLSPRVWREQAAFHTDLRKRKFDLTLDLQGYSKSGIYALATGAKHRFGWWRLRDGAQYGSRALPKRPESVHRVDWFLDAARALGADPGSVRFPLQIPAKARSYIEELVPSNPYAVLNPATGDQMRRWSARDFAMVAAKLAGEMGISAVLVGSGKDEPLCRSIVEMATEIGPGAKIFSLAGKTDVKQLAALLDRAAIHVAGDTGSLHIAAALGRPVVALFGPTDPAHAGPWGQLENVVTARDACGERCTSRVCVFGPGEQGAAEARCMRGISPDAVLARIRSVIDLPA
jgi:heptosyltransferase I